MDASSCSRVMISLTNLGSVPGGTSGAAVRCVRYE